MLIKHSAMLSFMNTGEPFNCTYLKKDGTLAEFTGVRKAISVPSEVQGQPSAGTDTGRKARPLQQYKSLVPFVTASGDIRELYTRLIIKFNDNEVVL